MRRVLCSFLVAAFVAVPSWGESPRLSIPVTTYEGFGQVCPISPDVALTARHIAFTDSDGLEKTAIPLRWSLPGSFKGGVAKGQIFLYSLDIASVKSSSPFPFYYTVSPVDPKLGDEVTLVGYDWEHGAKPVVAKGKIEGFSAGVMYFSKTPGPGSSGSCVFNKDGEVIGINFGGMSQNDGSTMGIAVVLTPEVLELLTANEEKASESAKD